MTTRTLRLKAGKEITWTKSSTHNRDITLALNGSYDPTGLVVVIDAKEDDQGDFVIQNYKDAEGDTDYIMSYELEWFDEISVPAEACGTLIQASAELDGIPRDSVESILEGAKALVARLEAL